MTNFLRIVKNSLKSFTRNIWLSVATLFMMFVALATVGGVLLFNASLNEFVAGLQEKVDISVYFKEDAGESDILKVKTQLEKREDIKSVKYVSKNEALDIFTQKHARNEVLIESLEELEGNPLQASINVKVYNPDLFIGVVEFLENSSSADFIDSINFRENEKVIESISNISRSVTKAGVAFMIILIALVLFVTFNTIRLAIYTAKDEIHIMKLVGASNWFTRGPFIATGALFGLTSGLLVVGGYFLATWTLDSQVSLIFSDIDFYGYLLSNWFNFSVTVVGTGLALGTISSYFAVRRYLKV